jgi:hypothetical protein
MRLLDARALIHQGVSRLVYDDEVGNPHYAILSHTWREEEVLFEDIPLGPDHEIMSPSVLRGRDSGYRSDSRPHRRPQRDPGEVDFGDLFRTLFESKTSRGAEVCARCTSDTVRIATVEQPHVKASWNKVLNTCLRACRDGYDYVWIDTCCIDKNSSAELSEAINSMFAWYEASAICYVYLDDCNLCLGSHHSPRSFAKQLEHWPYVSHCTIAQIQQCRWLTRGWTLQELIAPRQVAFFDRRWEFICESSAITKGLSDATGISEHLFQHTDSCDTRLFLRYIPVAEKMSWAANRETSRIEDEAYCLLGLFDVNMPLLYGEGARAFMRLQEEIMKTSADHSILAWEFRDVWDTAQLSKQVLAPSPAFFAWVTTIPRTEYYVGLELDHGIRGPYDRSFGMTNEGLNIWLPLNHSREEDDSSTTLALLDVGVGKLAKGQYMLRVALRLHQTTLKDRYLYSELTSMEPSEPEDHPVKFKQPIELVDGRNRRRLAFFAPSSFEFELEPTRLMIRRGPKGY